MGDATSAEIAIVSVSESGKGSGPSSALLDQSG